MSRSVISTSEDASVTSIAKRFECDQCHRVLSAKDHLKNHKARFHDGNGPKCDLCGAVFSTPYSVRRHMSQVHHGVRLQFECPHCSNPTRLFGDRSKLKQHLNAKHQGQVAVMMEKNVMMILSHDGQDSNDSPPKPTVNCPYCGARCSNDSNLDVHIALVHKTKRLVQCTRCGLTFFDQFQLSYHERHGNCSVRTETSTAVFECQQPQECCSNSNLIQSIIPLDNRTIAECDDSVRIKEENVESSSNSMINFKSASFEKLINHQLEESMNEESYSNSNSAINFESASFENHTICEFKDSIRTETNYSNVESIERVKNEDSNSGLLLCNISNYESTVNNEDDVSNRIINFEDSNNPPLIKLDLNSNVSNFDLTNEATDNDLLLVSSNPNQQTLYLNANLISKPNTTVIVLLSNLNEEAFELKPQTNRKTNSSQ